MMNKNSSWHEMNVMVFVRGPFWILTMQLSGARSGINHPQDLGMLRKLRDSWNMQLRAEKRNCQNEAPAFPLSRVSTFGGKQRWMRSEKITRSKNVTFLERKLSLFLNCHYSRVCVGNIGNNVKMAAKKNKRQICHRKD